MKLRLLTYAAMPSILAAFISCGEPKVAVPLYLDDTAPLEARVEDALSRLTLEEKVRMIHAQSKFSSPGVPRLGIPELWTSDGPHGIRPEVLWDEWDQAGWTNDSCVAFPALTCLAATWNEDMSALYGKSIGEEARFREKDVLLGPGVNIYRTPLNGRNFEYMGEDPFLASRMVVPYIKEVQKNGVAVCVKHYALNNQEANRHGYDAVVSDRALREIYLPAFKAAVQDGGAWSVMAAYNLYKGQHLCENQYLLDDILKNEWGFDGAVISDWGGVHNTDEVIAHGVDLEFGTWTDGLHSNSGKSYDWYHLANPYLKRLLDGRASVEGLDERVRRVLRLMMRTSMKMDKPLGEFCSEAHFAAAREIATEGIVLLKNDNNLLPISQSVKNILIVGENAVKSMVVGGGSSSLKTLREISPLEGITAAASERGIAVKYERGYVGDLENSYNGVSSGQNLMDSRSEDQLIRDAVAAASKADLVLFIGGLNKSNHQDCEDTDRFGLELPYAQDRLVEALAATGTPLTAVIISGNAVAMPWVDKVPAIVESWHSGSEAGNALADILFGKVNPSGKLPFTFPAALEDSPAHALNVYDPTASKAVYAEDIYVGYRWFDTKGISPLFAFGHGLSYTSFKYDNLKVKPRKNGYRATLTLTNTGKVDGKEVVQLYIRDDESSIDRPAKELKGFAKVALKAGESVKVSIDFGPEALKFFDPETQLWKAEKGSFTVMVGAASDDIRLTTAISL